MKEILHAHQEEFSQKAEVVFSAPGRFHLMGENSWFFKDKTLSMAIDLPVYVAISKREDTSIHCFFAQLNDRKKGNLSTLKYKKEDRWANAVKSIIYSFVNIGYTVSGMDITIYSEILPSAGFGITTAIKVATAKAVDSLFNLNCTDQQILMILDRANRKYLNQENHIADNFAALYAKKGTFLITDHRTGSYELIPITFEDKTILLVDAKVPRYELWNRETLYEPENALLLGDLKETKPHVFGGWKYIDDVTDINEQLSVVSEDTRRRLLCIMREHFDILEVVQSMEKKDFCQFARAVNHSHESMRDYFDLSCPEIDWILKRISELEPKLEYIHDPLSCGRITGKGFGRCMYAVLRNQDVETFKKKLVEYERIFGFKSQCYQVNSADGVTKLLG